MVATIVIVSLALVWLLIESRGLTIRLAVGGSGVVSYNDAIFDRDLDNDDTETTPLDTWQSVDLDYYIVVMNE